MCPYIFVIACVGMDRFPIKRRSSVLRRVPIQRTVDLNVGVDIEDVNYVVPQQEARKGRGRWKSGTVRESSGDFVDL